MEPTRDRRGSGTVSRDRAGARLTNRVRLEGASAVADDRRTGPQRRRKRGGGWGEWRCNSPSGTSPNLVTTPPAVLALFKQRELAAVKAVQKGVNRIRDLD